MSATTDEERKGEDFVKRVEELNQLRARMSRVKHKIAVMSGKGGVGKSLVTVNLAAALAAGGMILGPIVQKYAFGELWTGIPFGWDLTDNKTLIAVAAWILAVIMNRKREKPGYTIAAAVILLLVYSIPHSLFGSELDYVSGTVGQG